MAATKAWRAAGIGLALSAAAGTAAAQEAPVLLFDRPANCVTGLYPESCGWLIGPNHSVAIFYSARVLNIPDRVPVDDLRARDGDGPGPMLVYVAFDWGTVVLANRAAAGGLERMTLDRRPPPSTLPATSACYGYRYWTSDPGAGRPGRPDYAGRAEGLTCAVWRANPETGDDQLIGLNLEFSERWVPGSDSLPLPDFAPQAAAVIGSLRLGG